MAKERITNNSATVIYSTVINHSHEYRLGLNSDVIGFVIKDLLYSIGQESGG
jgi:hypothetical protein